MPTLRFRELPALVPGKTDCFMADPRKIVVDSEYNCRDMASAETIAHIDWLAEEIENTGFNPEMPLTVRRKDDEIILVRGHCRLAAVKKLIAKGIEVPGIPVMQLAAGTSDVDLIFDQEASNYGLRLDPLARARLVLKAKRLGISDEEIAKRMHWKSLNSVKQHLEMLEVLPEPVKEQVREGVIAATEATKVVKNLAKGTDPELAAALIKANHEENKKLGVGAKNNHKVTAKTLQRDAPKPKPVVTGHATGVTSNEAPTEMVFQVSDASVSSIEPAPSQVHTQLQTATERESGKVLPYANVRIDAILTTMIHCDVVMLARKYAQLVKEREASASEGEASPTQEQLCVAADVVGALRFPDEWEQAKANTELAAVA